VDFFQQLALAIAHPLLQHVLFLDRGAIIGVGKIFVFLQGLASVCSVAEHFVAQGFQAGTKECELGRVHVSRCRHFEQGGFSERLGGCWHRGTPCVC